MKRLLIPVLMLFGALMIQPVAAQSVAWTVAYYNNPYLLGNSVVERTEVGTSFNWGSGSPDPAVNPNTWSARFGTDQYFEAGTYRFTLQVDDQARLTVGDRVVFNTLDAPRIGETLTADITLTAGTQHMQIDYRELQGDAYINLTWVNTADIEPTAPVGTGTWEAQYFANTALAGTPAAILTEASPTHNWGLGAPIGSVAADNWSARWTSAATLDAGTYQLRVAADDGVRVFVDGVARINEWHLTTGQTYQTTFTLAAGLHTFVVEYYEAGFAASLFYEFLRVDQPTPQPGNPGDVVTNATIRAAVLNFRDAPTTAAAIIGKLRSGERYGVTGRNAESTWYRLNVNNQAGWVSALYVSVDNTGVVPVVGSGSTGGTPITTPVPTGLQVIALANVNLRSGPSTDNGVLTVMPRGANAELIGRTSATNWLQIRYNGVLGWVNFPYVQATTPLDFSTLPVSG